MGNRGAPDAGTGAYRVVAYDPRWPARFECERERLQRALGDGARRIEHVGSTAVPGLAAKPIIDIQVSVSSRDVLEEYRAALEGAGYAYLPIEGFEDYPLFLRRGEVHVHVCGSGSSNEFRHIAVRDYLRAHPAEASRYGEEKRRVASEAAGDRQRYITGKDAYVRALERRALAWATREAGPRSS